MKKKAVIAACVLAVPLLALFAGVRSLRAREEGVAVRHGPLFVWSVNEGQLDARRVEVVMSEFSGGATIVELAAEGQQVAEGDLLVRFDGSQVERDLVKLERDYALAKSALESLRQAELPLELRELDLQLLEAHDAFEAEKQYHEDSIELMKEDLVSEQEIRKQKLRLEQMRAKLAKLETQLELTKTYLHPSKVERATATLAAAEQAAALARQQLASCTVRAPAAGIVVYRPLHMGAEYRNVRVGDTLYKNQPFMALPDMNDVVAECYVPEADLALVKEGLRAVIVPVAYPDLRLEGKVETVGSMAQAMPGRPGWQKYFRVVIGVSLVDARLRPGMSVQCRILSYENPAAVLVPRAAVWWQDGKPHCRVRRLFGAETRALTLGQGNPLHYEVLAGLQPGDVLLTP
ncbi:MAG: efflux RND transporter periplasmic adaptor subunit [Kiritimatiellae bacterium]|nr:efflux RND transporter periplasmic adaptor subunit [Kiritimatiellia bacterium]